ncbi:MAG TPA: transglycosylase SLT domain-containing protein [Gemmatimonadales bacterium]|nr:transglycosylase SLT domain-containing protein [Gemmatimonadales bacterium]
MQIVRSLYERQSMVLMRHLYERMRRRTLVYRWLAVAAAVVAVGVGVRLVLVNRRIETIRRQAADVFYRMKTLELEVAHLQPGTAERKEYADQRARLEGVYTEWTGQLDKASSDPGDVRAIRAAVARLGEAPMLVSDGFIGDVRKRVAQWRRTSEFTSALRTATERGYPALIESVLAANSLPRDLVYLGFQESRFRPAAVGPDTRFGIAKGMWQLLPSTAREYGLRVGPLVGQPRYDPRDQRYDVTLATRAAVKYMGDLYMVDAQGSGLLVMASYNAGQTLVRHLLLSLPATPQDRNFWQLLEHHRDDIPDETYGYVVGIVAAAAAAAEPEAFGLRGL